jgi:hypothetical protein
MRITLSVFGMLFGLALPAYGQAVSAKPQLLRENAYNPIPSPDGKFIAYVATGWGPPGSFFGMGRASLWTNVELMDGAGTFVRSLMKEMFLAGWSADSHGVIGFRDGRYAVLTTDGFTLDSGQTIRGSEEFAPERVAFLNDLRRPVWMDRQDNVTVLRTSAETLPSPEGGFFGANLLAPSPDGRYISFTNARGPMRIWDRTQGQMADLVPAIVSPSRDWQYMQPAWDPWFVNNGFADSTRLVFFSGKDLVVMSADGKTKSVIATVDQPGGLAVPSPDGRSIAYVSFRLPPSAVSSEQRFWGDTSIWVVATDGKSPPRQLTEDHPDTTTGLRWLGNDSLVFDTIGKNLIKDMHARIWKVAVH